MAFILKNHVQEETSCRAELLHPGYRIDLSLTLPLKRWLPLLSGFLGTLSPLASLPPGTTTISFYFHQSYDNLDGTERIYINLLTPGCENYPIDSNQP